MAELDSNPALSGSIAYILSAPSPENITANLDLSNIGDIAHSFLVVSLSHYTYHLMFSPIWRCSLKFNVWGKNTQELKIILHFNECFNHGKLKEQGINANKNVLDI